MTVFSNFGKYGIFAAGGGPAPLVATGGTINTYSSGGSNYKPHNSWTLDDDTCHWEAPITYPDDDEAYTWDEDLYQSDNTKGWVEIE